MFDLLNDHQERDPIRRIADSTDDADKSTEGAAHSYSRVFEDWLTNYRSQLAKHFQGEPMRKTANTPESADAE